MPDQDIVTPSLRNPFELDAEKGATDDAARGAGPYDVALHEGEQLRARPRTAAGPVPIGRQHARSEERRVGKECRSRWSPYH